MRKNNYGIYMLRITRKFILEKYSLGIIGVSSQGIYIWRKIEKKIYYQNYSLGII